MKEKIKRIKGLTLASLVVFLSATTLTVGPVRLAKSMWQLEQHALVASMMTGEWPDTARVPAVESKFQFEPTMKPNKAPVLDLVKEYGGAGEVFGGVKILNDEIFDFRRKDRLTNGDANWVKERRKYEKLYTGETMIRYEPYELDSLARPGRKHYVVLADGVVKWTGTKHEAEMGWVMVRNGENAAAAWDLEAVNKQLMFLARHWLAPGATPAEAFPKALKAYREQGIKLPVLGVEVLSPWLGIAILILALYLAISLAHAIYELRDAKIDDSEPWIAYQSWTPRNCRERWIFKAFAVFGAVTSLVAIVLPLASVVIVEALVDEWLFFSTLLLVGTAVLISLCEFIWLLRRGGLAPKTEEVAEGSAGD